ncbi:hypothetical protein NX801_23235 [Streptomyces sp. LP05-1]|uniref:Lipoprotein n=1 Tax=Streptomyces pyxinae TaxID=2970734 RepID=A0ABT2CM65_9ACTN|nr:hypothetical protein [Streptomyces sp. LP05-1]MCS0638519.1 hypothetical protein [Streptomyces sp. LP05-1]
MRTNRVLLAAVAPVLAIALAGCGGDDGGAKIPTAGGGASTAAGKEGGRSDLAAYVEGKRAWVKCLRDNGVQIDDPDEKGEIDLGDGDTVRGLKKDPKFLAAVKKCESVDPPAPEGLEKSLNPLTPEQIKVRRDYADCMQKNGAPDFPAPGPDGYDSENAGEWNQSSAGAKRAARLCAPVLGVPAVPPSAKG